MPSTTTRLSNLNEREKRFLIGGAIIVVLLLAYLLWPSGEADQSNVDLVPADQRTGAAPVAQPAPAPMPVAPVPVPVVAAPPAAAAGAPEGLRLQGVAGGGAIFTFADGSQRYVARGRPVAPGLVLQATALRHVILASGGTAYRLGFGGPATAMAPPSAAAPAVAPSPVATPAAAERADTARYRTALTPHQVDGRTIGYAIRPGVQLPVLERAGLRSGDVIVSVNGHSIDSGEKVEELAREINAASNTEFEIIRGGQRQRFSLQIPASR